MTETVAGTGSESREPESFGTFSGLRLPILAFCWLALLILIKVFLVPLAFFHFGDRITEVEALHCCWLANLLGMGAAVDGDVVATPYFAIRVTQSCTGLEYLLYMVGMVALFPVRPLHRGFWTILLPLCLYLMLILRLTFLLFIGRFYPTWVSVLHDTWNLGFLLFFVGIWLTFVRVQVRCEPADG